MGPFTPILGTQAGLTEGTDCQQPIGCRGRGRKDPPADAKIQRTHAAARIPNPGQIFCIGLNYGEHVRETGKEVTETPVIFLRLPQSQVAHGQDIVRPPESHRLDYEAEIAVVIGKGGRRISEADASHIAGYSCYNDESIRDWQVATSQWTPRKTSGAPVASVPGWSRPMKSHPIRR